MGAFSFLKSQKAVKITNNLYLGDKNNAPEDAEFIVVCAIELMKAYVKLHRKKHPVKINEIVYDINKPRIFLKLIDWANFNQVNVQTSVEALNIIDEKLKENKKVYVHCVYGVNRSASHVFMYVVGKKLINEPTFKKALKRFKKIYTAINPIFGWKKLLKYYYPYHDFFDKDIPILDKKTAIQRYRQEKWIKKVKIIANRKGKKFNAKNIRKSKRKQR